MTIRTLDHNRRMRRAVLGCLLTCVLLGAAAAGARTANPSPLTPKLTRALAVGGLNGATRAAVAVDLQTGEILYKERRFAAMAPASKEPPLAGPGAGAEREAADPVCRPPRPRRHLSDPDGRPRRRRTRRQDLARQ